ncbi:Predicted phosphohydrolase, MPP superfamily [Ruaniaceae bacterium KH17]|nr:Predicted phosphohydrolase, MPP superfamily [Ruaniaceae bacterium KH17]
MLKRLAAATVAAGAGALTWGLTESLLGFTVRTHAFRARVPQPFTILHLSDLHLTRRDRLRIDFVRSLAELQPDFVALTGDNFGNATGPDVIFDALSPLFEIPGAFVFGSHDYVAGPFRSPIHYFGEHREASITGPHNLPGEAFAEELASHGWYDLNNARVHAVVRGLRVALVGVNDPHVGYDYYPQPDGDHGDLQVALIHAPYQRVLDEALHDGTDLALCGHTHGGQVCVPLYGALVNNADTPTWRASGLQGWPGLRPDGKIIEPLRLLSPARKAVLLEAERSMWLNISAGLGTSPHVPVRVACRPEVSLLTILPA